MILTVPDDWMAEAACRGTDPRLWFPSRDTSEATYERARAICDGCNVRDECLAAALANPPKGDVSIWAGTTPPERAELRDDDGIRWG